MHYPGNNVNGLIIIIIFSCAISTATLSPVTTKLLFRVETNFYLFIQMQTKILLVIKNKNPLFKHIKKNCFIIQFLTDFAGNLDKSWGVYCVSSLHFWKINTAAKSKFQSKVKKYLKQFSLPKTHVVKNNQNEQKTLPR